MKVSEAIAILEALDPNMEVTLILGRSAKGKTEPAPKFTEYPPGQFIPMWQEPHYPNRNYISCKVH